MTKCICGVKISPYNVGDHQKCGIDKYVSDVTLASVKEMVAENKQRFIKFPYTWEVVDFLLASIEDITFNYQQLGEATKREAIRAEKAEAEVERRKSGENLLQILVDDSHERERKLIAENERLRRQNAEQDALLGNPAVPIDSGGFNLVSKLSESESLNATLTKENTALNTEKVGMIASLDAMGAEIERLREEEVSWVSCGVQNAAKVLKVEAENAALAATEKE